MTVQLAWLMTMMACTADPAEPDPTSPPTSQPSASDTALDTLALGAVPLQPAFDPDQHYYAVRAADLVDGAVLEATPVDPAATLRVLHETVDGDSIAEGSVGDPWTLAADERLVVEVDRDGALERYAVFVLPDDLPVLELELTGTPTAGFTFLSNFDFEGQPPGIGRYALIVDPVGTPVWWRRTEQPSFDLRIGDGRLTWLVIEPGQPMVGAVLDPVTMETLETYQPVQPTTMEWLGTDPHEFEALPGGGALIIGIGGRVRDLSPWGGTTEGIVIDNVVQELAPDGSVVFEWTTEDVDLDDLPQNLLAMLPLMPEFEVAHANSVEVDPFDGNWVISMRLLSQVVKVARGETVWGGRTYAPGEVVWTLGGPASDFTFVDDDREGGWQGFSEQHSARMQAADRLMLFDNGTSFDLGATGAARGVEYQLDEAAMTATLVWEHELERGGPTPAAGSVQRIGEGSTLICWGSTQILDDGSKGPALSEVDASGAVVRQVWLPDDQWTYRAWHFDGDPLTGVWD